jgi:hypothetical protein
MQKLILSQIAPTNCRIIPVASERFESEANQIETIQVGNDTYKVSDCYSYERGELIPNALKRLGYGKDVPDEKIWEKFKNSEKMYFFVVEVL